MFEYFVRPHICLSVSVDVAFCFKLGFGREGRGFESGFWFWVGVVCFFKWSFVWGVVLLCHRGLFFIIFLLRGLFVY